MSSIERMYVDAWLNGTVGLNGTMVVRRWSRRKTVVAFKAFEETSGIRDNSALIVWNPGNPILDFRDRGWYGLKRSVIPLGLEED